MKESLGLYRGVLELHVHVPALTKGRQQLHSMEIEHTRGLAPVSIHVETAIDYVHKK